MMSTFFIVFCCLTSDSFASTNTLDLIQQKNDPYYNLLASKYWAWNNQEKNETNTLDLNEEKNETVPLNLNEEKNENDTLCLNEEENLNKFEYNDEKNETDTLNVNEDKNETNTQNLNEDDNESDPQNNEQENVTDTLNLNELENVTNKLNLNEEKNETNTIDLVKHSSGYAYYGCSCSAPSFFKAFKIIGGFSVLDDISFPYQALFYVSGFSCGATILNQRYLLSAMHCIFNQNGALLQPSDALILVGTSKFSVAGGAVLKASEFILHPDYNRATMQNDILIIKVEGHIQFSSSVRPACLPTSKSESFVGRDATVTGWGATVGYETIPPYDLGYPNTLKHTTVKVLDPRDRRCAADTLLDPVTKLCAYTTGTDACQGDSGGPLTVVEGGVHTIIGVVSYGFGCAAKNHPGIYARVTNYLDWIVSHTWDGRC